MREFASIVLNWTVSHSYFFLLLRLLNDVTAVSRLLVEPSKLGKLIGHSLSTHVNAMLRNVLYNLRTLHTDFFRTSSAQTIQMVHKPMVDMMNKSPEVCRALGRSTFRFKSGRFSIKIPLCQVNLPYLLVHW